MNFIPHSFFSTQELPSDNFLFHPFDDQSSAHVLSEANPTVQPIVGSHLGNEEPYTFITESETSDISRNLWLHHLHPFGQFTNANAANVDHCQSQGQSQLQNQYQSSFLSQTNNFQMSGYPHELSEPNWLQPAAATIIPPHSPSDGYSLPYNTNPNLLPQAMPLGTAQNTDRYTQNENSGFPKFSVSNQNSFQTEFNTQELVNSMYNSFTTQDQFVGKENNDPLSFEGFSDDQYAFLLPENRDCTMNEVTTEKPISPKKGS
ncbi:hypothetical protein BY458DRAFT_161032 [Sporodiniella umbellata]|nr:hypothetical protein BY458DRAFT_161032 [Sporodiniella umbellata]